ncbi:hypothetical protein F5Y14DRAFT_201525 [Nemania sp. NC0429]|nr:hypothetical protein F5Y14DRAFT_201525 [Nemania sp. NC0429]
MGDSLTTRLVRYRWAAVNYCCPVACSDIDLLVTMAVFASMFVQIIIMLKFHVISESARSTMSKKLRRTGEMTVTLYFTVGISGIGAPELLGVRTVLT